MQDIIRTPNLAWLSDPTVFRVNRLDAHSDHVVYSTMQELEQGCSSLRQSLDGTWAFQWSENPDVRPADFWQEDADLSGFGTIQVPGHMELQGYGEIQYMNKTFPWDGKEQIRPPQIPWKTNYVGSYVRCFDLDPALQGQRVFISFLGAERAMFAWLNGHFLGYAEDSFAPSDFDITPYVKESGNRLCVEVFRHCTGSWLEDQDFFRFSGLFRSVYLYAKPAVYVDDLWLKAGLDEDNTTGRLTARLLLSGDAAHARVYCKITHPADGTLFNDLLPLREDGGYWWSPELVFPDIRKWDNADPQLYRVLLTVTDDRGRVMGLIPYDIGFRRVEIVDKIICLNGQRLIINGINRHEWSVNGGRCLTDEDFQLAISVFKRNRINAVRTCHYPNRTEWYHLCDREGIYMMDETNMETHGTWQTDMGDNPSINVPASRPEWLDAVLDRAASLFERDKNHVAILFWSCGNESYGGTDIVAMHDFFRRMDSSRVVHYEGVTHCPQFRAATDVESRMYPQPDDVRAYLENDPDLPFLNCEYMHCMGNSMGGMESYMKLQEEFPMYQGGFLWDYMDQALWHTDASGKMHLGYGGDFDDRLCDFAFSCNGIVSADGKEKPATEEIRYWFLPTEERKAFDEANAKARAEAKLPAHGEKTSGMEVVHGDVAIGVSGEGYSILFSLVAGGPISLKLRGTEWLWRAPRPAFWRAPTENDLGCAFPAKSAVWSAVDTWQKCSGFRITEETDRRFTIEYSFTADPMPSLKTTVAYTVLAEGYLEISTRYEGAEGRPQLPVFGLRLSTTKPVDETAWLGLSGETYPDRYKGSSYGFHREAPHIPEYIVPQECGNHQFTDYAAFRMGAGTLEVEKVDAPFAFSAIPYTPAQLELAAHREELPESYRTVLTFAGAMRGVGGIDSWMTDVEPAYHLTADRDYSLTIRVRL